MTGADGVDVVLLHHREILHQLGRADGKAGHRIAVVAVGSPEFNVHAVDVNHAVRHMDLPDSHLICDHLIFRLQHQGVQIRLLRVPQMRLLKGHDRLSVLRLRLRRQSALSVEEAGLYGDRVIQIPEGDLHIAAS